MKLLQTNYKPANIISAEFHDWIILIISVLISLIFIYILYIRSNWSANNHLVQHLGLIRFDGRICINRKQDIMINFKYEISPDDLYLRRKQNLMNNCWFYWFYKFEAIALNIHFLELGVQVMNNYLQVTKSTRGSSFLTTICSSPILAIFPHVGWNEECSAIPLSANDLCKIRIWLCS